MVSSVANSALQRGLPLKARDTGGHIVAQSALVADSTASKDSALIHTDSQRFALWKSARELSLARRRAGYSRFYQNFRGGLLV